MASTGDAPISGVSTQLLSKIGVADLLVLVIGILFLKYVYRVTFHPLASYPGPKLPALTRLWFVYHLIKGDLVYKVQELHDQYGSVVRVAPNELAFIRSNGWRDIYGFRHGKPEMPKDTPFYKAEGQPDNILNSNHDMHSYLRRLMSHAFSDSSLRAQEPVIQSYVNLMISRLRDISGKGEAANLVAWYNYLTFDIIGDLAFGEPFGSLETSKYHPWVQMVFDSLHFNTVGQAIGYYPNLLKLIPTSFFRGLSKNFHTHTRMTREKAIRRKESKTDRGIFTSNLVKPENNISDKQLMGNCSTLIIGGSETTATALCGITYFTMQTSGVLSKLTHEIRSTFKTHTEITSIAVNQLPYLSACVNEALRMFPPAPTGLSRKVPEGGDEIDGRFVAEGTHVSVFQWAANMSSTNFFQPTEFIPERWMDDPRFATDDHSAMQVFGFGPRNCIGKNLAYVELRLVIARMLFEFDLEPAENLENWANTKAFTVWEKKPMWVKLKSVA